MHSSLMGPSALVPLALLATGCMGNAHAASPVARAPEAVSVTTRAAPPAELRLHRFDFVVTTTPVGGSPTSVAFSMNLQEGLRGEVSIGKNVPLAGSNARQDVGIKVVAHYRSLGDAVILDADAEMTGTESSSTPAASAIHKMIVRGNTLLASGKPTIVGVMEDDRGRHQLTVTSEKLR